MDAESGGGEPIQVMVISVRPIFRVFNPDESGETELRFKTMLGPGAIQRFKYFPLKFENCLGDIFESIKLKRR